MQSTGFPLYNPVNCAALFLSPAISGCHHSSRQSTAGQPPLCSFPACFSSLGKQTNSRTRAIVPKPRPHSCRQRGIAETVAKRGVSFLKRDEHNHRRDERTRRLRPMRVFVFDSSPLHQHRAAACDIEGRQSRIERRQRIEARSFQILVAAPVGEDAKRVDNHHAPQLAPIGRSDGGQLAFRIDDDDRGA